MTPRKVAQPLELDGLDDQTVSPIIPPVDPPKPSKVGQHMGAKSCWSDEQVHLILQSFYGTYQVRDRAWFICNVLWAFRISELLGMKIKDLCNADGSLKDYFFIAGSRLKGGQHVPKPPKKQEGHPDLCFCRGCKLYRGEILQKPRRKPPDRPALIPQPLRPYLQAWLQVLAKTRNGLDPERYVFEGRKQRAYVYDPVTGEEMPKKSLHISRQQGHYVLVRTMKACGIDWHLHGTHAMRKTGGQRVYERDGLIAARDFLGHASSATTDKYLSGSINQRFLTVAAIAETLVPVMPLPPTPTAPALPKPRKTPVRKATPQRKVA